MPDVLHEIWTGHTPLWWWYNHKSQMYCNLRKRSGQAFTSECIQCTTSLRLGWWCYDDNIINKVTSTVRNLDKLLTAAWRPGWWQYDGDIITKVRCTVRDLDKLLTAAWRLGWCRYDDDIITKVRCTVRDLDKLLTAAWRPGWWRYNHKSQMYCERPGQATRHCMDAGLMTI